MSHEPTPTYRLDTRAEGMSIDWMGSDVRLPVRSDETGGRLSAQLATLADGAGNPPHCHSREDELFYVLAGSLTVRVAGETITLDAGDLAYAPAGLPHTIKNDSGGEVRLLVVLAPGGIESAFVAAAGKGPKGVKAAFEPAGVVFLDEFDPDYRHRDVAEPGTPIVSRAEPDRPLHERVTAGLTVTDLRLTEGRTAEVKAMHALLVTEGRVRVADVERGEEVVAGVDDVLNVHGGRVVSLRSDDGGPAAVVAVGLPLE